MQHFLTIPGEPWADDLDRAFSRPAVPICVQQIFWDSHVDVLSVAFSNNELLRSVIKVNHICEIRRKEIWHACLVDESLGESFDLVKLVPFDCLSIVFYLLTTLLKWAFNLVTIFIDISSVVDGANEIIDDLHHFCCILAQVKSLHGLRAHIPVEVSQVVSFLLSDYIEQEVESTLNLTLLLRVVLMYRELHDFEVV